MGSERGERERKKLGLWHGNGENWEQKTGGPVLRFVALVDLSMYINDFKYDPSHGWANKIS